MDNQILNDQMIAACGLLCGNCDIRKLPFDEQSAQVCITWYRDMGWLEENEGVEVALERGMYCRGCLGPRDIQWSPECWILLCAVDKRGLKNCSECQEFPCQDLLEWSNQNDRYAAALERLNEMNMD